MAEVWTIESDGGSELGELARRDDGEAAWTLELVSRGDARATGAGVLVLDAGERALVARYDEQRCRVRADTTALGPRRWRETIEDALDLVTLVVEGTVVARVSDEDEPYEIGCGGALWIADPGAGDELELLGLGPRARVLTVGFERLRSVPLSARAGRR